VTFISQSYELKLGHIFEGKYRIIRELGRGGFGMVYLAHQESMDRHVALKILKPGVGAHAPAARERFLREVKIISRLRHPNTVTIHDYGETLEGVVYMVLEHIEGITFKDLLRDEGAQTPYRALLLVRQVARSLAEAHRHGIVHRDLKPANIMVMDLETESDLVKVLDFGVARLLNNPVDNDLTSAGVPVGERALIGTPRYMSPEQVRGEDLTGASDIYSLGLILYELLIGEPAVQGDTTMGLISQQLSSEPLKLPNLRALPSVLQPIIRQATEKTILRRFRTAEEFADAIDHALSTVANEQGPGQGRSFFHASGSYPSVGGSGRHRTMSQGAVGAHAAMAAASVPVHSFEPAPAPEARREDTLSVFGSDLPLPPNAAEPSPFAEPEPDLELEKVERPPGTMAEDATFSDTLRIVVFGCIALFGIYLAFIVSGTIFDAFLNGFQKLFASALLAIAIPLLTALGENSQKERFHVVTRPADRIVRVCVGSAIFSFMTAILIGFAMSGTVTHQLRYNSNWFLKDDAPTLEESRGLALINYRLSTNVADIVETVTSAMGIYEGVPTLQDAQPTTPTIARPPEPTRPSTRPSTRPTTAGGSTQETASESDEGLRDSPPSDPTPSAGSQGTVERPAAQPSTTPAPTRPATPRKTEDSDYVRW
jgi:eukaryotic-like serine/threonine-protein kinase